MSNHTESNHSESYSSGNYSRRSSESNNSRSSETFKNNNHSGTFLNMNLLFLFVFGLFLYMSVKTPMFPNLNQTKKVLLDRLVNVLSSDKKKLI